jgi:hypothetical protein
MKCNVMTFSITTHNVVAFSIIKLIIALNVKHYNLTVENLAECRIQLIFRLSL